MAEIMITLQIRSIISCSIVFRIASDYDCDIQFFITVELRPRRKVFGRRIVRRIDNSDYFNR